MTRGCGGGGLFRRGGGSSYTYPPGTYGGAAVQPYGYAGGPGGGYGAGGMMGLHGRFVPGYGGRAIGAAAGMMGGGTMGGGMVSY